MSKSQDVSIRQGPVFRVLTRVRDHVNQINELREDLIKDLLFLQQHQDELLKITKHKTFEQFIKEEVKITKQSYYAHIQAYNVSPALYTTVKDFRVLTDVSRLNDNKKKEEVLQQIRKNPDITRAQLRKVSPGLLTPKKSQKTSIHPDVQIKSFLRKYKGRLSDAAKHELKKFIDSL